jgi:hypothetical protein
MPFFNARYKFGFGKALKPNARIYGLGGLAKVFFCLGEEDTEPEC